MDDGSDAAAEVYISNNIVRMTYGTPPSSDAMGIVPLDDFATADNGLYIAKVWNNIVYGFRGTGATRVIHADNYGTVYAFNNTLIGDSGAASTSLGFDGSSTNLIYVKNNIAIDATEPYRDVVTGAGSNNNVSDAGDAPPSGARNCEPTFADKAGDDYHLDPGDTCAQDFGADLSSDSNLAFIDDIDLGLRTTPWDIGADDVLGGAAANLTQIHYRWRNDDGGEGGGGGISETGSATNTGPGSPASITHGLTINAGDVIVAMIQGNDFPIDFTDNNGANAFTEQFEEQNGGGSSSYAIYYRVAGASEPASYSWNLSSSVAWSGQIRVFSGVDTASVWDVAPSVSTRASAGSGTTATAPTMTTSTDGAMGIIAFFSDSLETFSNPTNGYGTEVEPGGRAQASYIRTWASAGATGASSADLSLSNDWLAHQFALKPAVSAGGATFAAAEDAQLIGLAKGAIRRVRFEVSNEGGTSGAVTYRLEVAETATCAAGSYTAVPTDTSGHWQVIDSSFITDGEATTNVVSGLTDEATTFVPGESKDAGSTTGSITLNADEFTEIEFAVQATSIATNGGDYCFRLFNATLASVLDAYSVYAEVSLAGATLSLADHDAGQISDQFATTTPVTSELFGFKLTQNGTATVDNVRVHLTTTGGVANGDVTSGDLYRDENDDGLIDGGDTPLVTGVTPSGGVLAFTSLSENPGTGTNYLVQAIVANLVAGDTTTFSVDIGDIDELEGGVTESGAASNAVHTFDSVSGGDVFYSVGTSRATSTDLKTGSPTITITNGTATFSVAQTGDIGVGDEIDYGSLAYIKSVLSQTQFVVHMANGGVPGNVSGVTVNSIMRAFDTLANAELNSGTGSYLGNFDLTAVNATLTWVAYNDAAFTAGATIDGYTTDATHFITLTVAGSSQVASGTSQRHNGTAGTGVVLDGQDTDQGIRVQDDYTTVEWFEFKRNRGGATAVSVQTRDATNILLQNLLIYDFDDAANFVAGIKGEDNSSYTVRNSIIYDGDSAAIRNQNVTTTGTVENCTLYGSQRGVLVDAGTMTVTNTIALGNTTADYQGTMTGSHNMSTDGTASSAFGADPNAITGASSAVEFVDDNFATADLHLIAGAQAINSATNLSGTFTNDIDEETRSGLWDMGADEQGPGGDVYYSVGTDNTDLKNGSPTISILNGTATLSVAQTGNIGVGDEIDYDSDNKKAYIKSVLSQTEFVLTTAAGAVPGNVTNVAVNSIMRAFNDFVTAEANSGDASHLNNFDLTGAGANAKLTWVAYNDAAFANGPTIDSYTTDASHFITLTVAGASQVASGVSQRHTGIEGTGGVVDGTNVALTGIDILNDYTVVEWLELTRLGPASEVVSVDAANVLLTHLIIYNMLDHGIDHTGAGVSFTIRNSLIYGGGGDGISWSSGGGDVTIENCTIYGMGSRGIEENAGIYTVRNTLSMGNVVDFDVSNGTQANNMSSDATALPVANQNKLPGDQFIDHLGPPPNFHLKSIAAAIDAGANLSGSFTNDIDDQARNGLWDIGADESGCAFGCSMQITIDHTQVGLNNNPGSLSNFPVLIDITDADLQLAPTGKVENGSGYDIVFRAADGVTPLDHEIEDYDSGSGRIRAWVRIPSLPKDVDTVIYMRFGSACVTSSQENVTGVWDANYAGVWHLPEDPGPGGAGDIKDSTANVNHGTAEASMIPANQVSGQIEGSLDFDGADDHVNAGSDASLDDFTNYTMEAWIKPAGWGEAPATGFGRILDKRRRKIFLVSTENGINNTMKSFHTFSGIDSVWFAPSDALSLNTWAHVAVTYDVSSTSNVPTFYINGQPVTATLDPDYVGGPTGTFVSDAADDLYIGNWVTGDRAYEGIIDEARFSGVIRSADWIRTSYNNQFAPGSFYTVAAASSTFTLADHTAGQVSDKFTTSTPVTDALFAFNLSRSGGATVDTLRVNFTTVGGVASGDVTSGELWRDENNDGAVDGGDTLIQSGVTPSGGVLTFTSNFSPAVAGTNYLVQVTVANLVDGDTTTFSLAPEDIDTVELNVCSSGSTSSAVHTQDPLTLVLADHDTGQVADQFATATPVTSELFAFKLSTVGTVTVDNIRAHFSTTGGVASGDVTSGELHRDNNNDGVINGGDTAIQTGVTPVGGVLSFTSLAESPAAGANYLVRATVANLVAGDVTTFALATVDIDEVESGVTEVGAASFAIHTFDNASGGDVFYSVGISRATATDLKTGSPTININNGTATFSEVQTGNVGVGDEINYGAGSLAYIRSVLSQTQFVVHTATGGVPGTVSGVTVNSIMRAFPSLASAEANSGDGSHLNNFDLTAVGADANLHWVCYNDGALAAVNINSYTTDPTHTITLTVAGDLQVASGVGQHHDGTAGSGVRIDNSGGSGDAVVIGDDYVTVEWLEIDNGFLGAADGVQISTAGVNQLTILRNNLIHDIEREGIVTGSFDVNVDIINNIIYDGNARGIRINGPLNGGNQVRILNNTIYNMPLGGLVVSSGTAMPLLQNNIIHSSTPAPDFSASNLDLNSSNNLASDVTGIPHSPNLGGQNNVSLANMNFVNEPGRDLHIGGGSAAQNAGADLSGIFTNDIDDEARATNWDIGADETRTTVNYRSIGTASDDSTNTVTATNGSTVVTGDTTLWLTNNRGRGDVITIPCPDPPACTGGADYTVLSVDSETQLTLTTNFSGTDGPGLTYTISRQFTTLQGWENCISGAGGCTYFPVVGGDLVADGRAEVGIAYDDEVGADFTDVLVVNGATTDADHDITLTVDGDNRHYGRAGDGVVLDPVAAGHAITVDQVDYVHIEWLEITGWTGDSAEAVRINADNTLYEFMIVHDPVDPCTANDCETDGFYLQADGDWTATIRNSIVYNIDRAGIHMQNIGGGVSTQVLNLENLTVYNNGRSGTPSTNENAMAGGITVAATTNHSSTINARNVISVGNVDVDGDGDADFNVDQGNGGGTVSWGSSEYNISSDGTATVIGTNSFANRDYTGVASPGLPPQGQGWVMFQNLTPGSEDFHLRDDLAQNDALQAGTDLSASFSQDIDGGNRVAPCGTSVRMRSKRRRRWS